MTDNQPHNDHLSPDDLRNYRAGVLSAAERHRVERLLLENPLYAEALEGMETAEQETSDLTRVSNELRQRLQKRIEDDKTRRLPRWISALAASIALVMGIGLFLWLPETPEEEQAVEVFRQPPALEKAVAPADQRPSRRPAPLPPASLQTKRPTLAREAASPRDSLPMPRQDWLANSGKLGHVQEPVAITGPASVPALSRKITESAVDSIQQPAVSGFVVGDDNLPLPGVVVLFKNSQRATITDTAGRFRLTQRPKDDSLQISFIGYQMKTIRVDDLPPSSVVRLQPDTAVLSEVVIVGYGVQKEQVRSNRAFGANPAKIVAPRAPAGFEEYLTKNRQLPPEAKEKGISGTVRVRFRVETNGTVRQFSVVQSLGNGCDEEAIRLIQEGPRWQPALRKGKPFAAFTEHEIVF
ncbi:TonB family protein [Larkinella insperata]|uniref:TonB family protein n=1 Tax=Larkinella insperata TaxID=332158 RepID=A0ABW3QLA7_9BACT|nr:TonB family protein [Larkinella insperata]